ncbi:MAG TPA: hypothetical protein VNI02_06080 [Blastocatellia bacterium]|nr:hypothetical protein [Blastocatellia bacterium]
MKSEHHETGAPAESNSIDKQLIELRSQISDIGYEIDLYKSGIAASMGGGLFLLLLAAGAGYDIITGKAGIWSSVGVTRDLLLFIAWGLGAAGAVLVIQGIVRQRRRDREREARLAELELQYSRLLDRKELISQGQS